MPLPDFKPAQRAGTLWMYTMPGLTSDILKEGAEALNLIWNGQMVNLHPTQWIAYKLWCSEKLELPEDWEWTSYLHWYQKQKEAGWGKRYGTGSPGGWKRKEKKEYVEVDRSNKGWDTSGTLFDSSLSGSDEEDV